MGLKLIDVIYEITLKCNKGCKYCGSENVLQKENPSLEHMLHIAKEIGSYGVKVITLSGGEPGEITENDIVQVIETLQSYGCNVRAITNGRLLKHDRSGAVDLLDMIGLSVNLVSDIPKEMTGWQNIVMVTNFGTHNIWEFETLAEVARSFKSWQIQLTTGSEFMLPPEGILYLRKKIRELEGIKYILADNLQDEHKCSAGIVSCGITANGDVIPCLSERTSGYVSVQGNLFERSLKDIWETEFKDIRFGSDTWSKSCGNCISYPKIDKLTPTIAPKEKVSIKSRGRSGKVPDKRIPPNYKRCSGNVMSYGVTDWNVMSLSCYEEEMWK
jgi:radical SAM protein with 4Fe4S-binding SPASM domain